MSYSSKNCVFNTTDFLCLLRTDVCHSLNYLDKTYLFAPAWKKMVRLISFTEWANTPRVFQVETTWKRPFPPRFNVKYTWRVCIKHIWFCYFVKFFYFLFVSLYWGTGESVIVQLMGWDPKISEDKFCKDISVGCSNSLYCLSIKYELKCRKASLRWYFFSVSLFSISQLVKLD